MSCSHVRFRPAGAESDQELHFLVEVFVAEVGRPRSSRWHHFPGPDNIRTFRIASEVLVSPSDPQPVSVFKLETVMVAVDSPISASDCPDASQEERQAQANRGMGGGDLAPTTGTATRPWPGVFFQVIWRDRNRRSEIDTGANPEDWVFTLRGPGFDLRPDSGDASYPAQSYVPTVRGHDEPPACTGIWDIPSRRINISGNGAHDDPLIANRRREVQTRFSTYVYHALPGSTELDYENGPDHKFLWGFDRVLDEHLVVSGERGIHGTVDLLDLTGLSRNDHESRRLNRDSFEAARLGTVDPRIGEIDDVDPLVP